jgi:hypothetical protein
MPAFSSKPRFRSFYRFLQLFDQRIWLFVVLHVLVWAYIIAGLPGSVQLFFVNVLLFVLIVVRLTYRKTIITYFNYSFGRISHWNIHRRRYPPYKWYDLYRAAQSYTAEHARSSELLAFNPLPLFQLLQHPLQSVRERERFAVLMLPVKTSYNTEESLPNDTFWLIHGEQAFGHGDCIVRITWERGSIMLEIASERPEDGAHILEQLIERAQRNSIYRRKMISPVFQPQLRPHYGDEDDESNLSLVFQAPSNVTDETIVLEDSMHELIEWSVIDFHQRRDALKAVGLPGRRGILFYGPPGTGKTYTCKYIANRLPDATTIVVSGKDLGHIRYICQIARQFQPALVILEDIDLVFSSRENNMFSPALGDLFDELDGFQPDDAVIFLLTTNAIDRVEAAIKDRPGRVSQCIYLGPPNAELRRRYLRALLERYPAAADINLEPIIKRTEGASQAFLKEMVVRAVQLATAQQFTLDSASLRLTEQHLADAQAQMLQGNDSVGKRIIGFQVSTA